MKVINKILEFTATALIVYGVLLIGLYTLVWAIGGES